MITGANSTLWLSKSKVIIELVIVVSKRKRKESRLETGRIIGHIVLLLHFPCTNEALPRFV